MITVEHLNKCYGSFEAIRDLSFTLEEGHIYGFLGPNGAGKSTIMNIMTGCLSLTEGTVKVDGMDVFEEAEKTKKLIGYLPELPPLYINETPYEYLRFVARAKGIPAKEINNEIERVIGETGIEDVWDRLIRNLSKGYRQRCGIAQALLGNPRIIILDEPTVGLDPKQMIEIRELIRQLGQSHTVILSSHILSEVQMICDQVLIIAKGELAAFDTPENLEKNQGDVKITLRTDASVKEVEEIVDCVPGVRLDENKAEQGKTVAVISSSTREADDISEDIFKTFVKKEKILYALAPHKASLEDIFMELTGADESVPEEGGEESVSDLSA